MARVCSWESFRVVQEEQEGKAVEAMAGRASEQTEWMLVSLGCLERK